jgi:trehalose utilization protein
MHRGAIRVTVWNEFVDDRKIPFTYPHGIHAAISEGLQESLGDRVTIRTATFDEPEHGLPQAVLDQTDVLIWWGHSRHQQVADEVVDRVQSRVLDGMGFVPLHSSHHSKPFKRLMGTSGNLRYNDAEERAIVWTVNPSHPVTAGVPPVFVIPLEEMYAEYFDIPAPDELIFITSYPGGEVFRSGCCFRRGKGRIFYFSAGHESYPVYFQPEIRQVIANAVVWAGSGAPSSIDVTQSIESDHGWFEGT